LYTAKPVADLQFIKLNLFQEKQTLQSTKLNLFQGKQTLYASADEFQDLIKEVLSWDIRSLSQRIRPHQVTLEHETDNYASKCDKDYRKTEDCEATDSCSVVAYHLHLEGIDVSYKIDENSNVVVDNAALLHTAANQNRCCYLTWRDKISTM
jgi:hypothetical protein